MKIKILEHTLSPQAASQQSRPASTLGSLFLLASILLGASAAATAGITDGLLTFTENTNDGGLTVTGLNSRATGVVHDLTIPSGLNVGGIFKPVTAIGSYAFRYESWHLSLISGTVTLPESVVSIGENAFGEFKSEVHR